MLGSGRAQETGTRAVLATAQTVFAKAAADAARCCIAMRHLMYPEAAGAGQQPATDPLLSMAEWSRLFGELTGDTAAEAGHLDNNIQLAVMQLEEAGMGTQRQPAVPVPRRTANLIGVMADGQLLAAAAATVLGKL